MLEASMVDIGAASESFGDYFNDTDTDTDYDDVNMILPESQLSYLYVNDIDTNFFSTNDKVGEIYSSRNTEIHEVRQDQISNNDIHSLDEMNPPPVSGVDASNQTDSLLESTEPNLQRTDPLMTNDIDVVSEDPPRLRWSLRKRKAIQKMPYSLDKIIHQELLKGHKMPNIDEIEESQIASKLKQTTKRVYTENVPASSFWDYDNDSETDSDSQFIGNIANTENHQDFHIFEDPTLLNKSIEQNSIENDEDETSFLHKNRVKYTPAPVEGDSQTSDILPEFRKPVETDLLKNVDESDDTDASDVSSDSSKSSKDSDAQDIIFRGRVLNLKHGYKGVLPKSVWEAELKKQEDKERYKENKKKKILQRNLNKKGVAKTKTSKISNKENENKLLQDLLVNDDDPDEDDKENLTNQENKLHYKNGADEYLESSHSFEDFERVTSYMDIKYAGAYESDLDILSDSSLSDNGPNTFVLMDNEDVKEDLRQENFNMSALNEVYENDRDSVEFLTEKRNIQDESTSLTGYAKEHNYLDHMLAHVSIKSPINPKSKKTQGMNENKKTYKQILSNKPSHFSGSRKIKNGTNSRKFREIERGNTNDKTTCFIDSDTDSDGNMNISEIRKGPMKHVTKIRNILKSTNNKTCVKAPKSSEKRPVLKKKLIAEYFAPSFESSDPKYSKKLHQFTTIVEAPSSNFVLSRKGLLNRERTFHDETPETNPGFLGLLTGLPVFRSLFYNDLFTSPDIITLSVGEDTYTVSALSNDYLTVIKRLLVRVVKVGATDIELQNILIGLVQFVHHKNNQGILNVIQAFQIEFSKKLTRVIQKAKPIHFYTLATCQLIFYEISLFSSTIVERRDYIHKLIVDSVVNYFRLYKSALSVSNMEENEIISEGHLILKLVIKALSGAEKLWKHISKWESIGLDMFKLLHNLFPCTFTAPIWHLISPDANSFIRMRDYVEFIQSGINDRKWPLTKELVLNFYNTLKSRKFLDFTEETEPTYEYSIVDKSFSLVPTSIFNFFLNVLYQYPITVPMLERITPLGNLVDSRNQSQLPNRINLLLTLSLKSTIDFENKIDQIITNAPFSFDNSSFKLILKSLIALYSIKDKQGHTISGISLNTCYKYSNKFGAEFLTAWREFLGELQGIIKNFETNRTHLLKSLINIFISEAKERITLSSLNIKKLLGIICSNLEFLEPQWVEHNIFQTLSSVNCDDFFKYYCGTLKYLIKHDILTIWSVLTYYSNVSKYSKNSQLMFYESILNCCCDDASYTQLKSIIVPVLLENIFEEHSMSFLYLAKAFFSKTETISKKFVIHSLVSRFENICQIITFLGLLKDMNVIDKLMHKLKIFCDSNDNSSLANDIVLYINKFLIDLVKNNQIFQYLKQRYHISNKETNKSVFKDNINGIPTPHLQAAFITKELSQAITYNLGVQESEEKIFAAISDNVSLKKYELLCELIKCLLAVKSNIAYQIATVLMRIMNNVLENVFLYVTSADYLVLLKFGCNICGSCGKEFEISSIENHGIFFLKEFYFFLVNMKFITENFYESQILLQNIHNFLSKNVTASILCDNQMFKKLQHMLIGTNASKINNDEMQSIKIELKNINL